MIGDTNEYMLPARIAPAEPKSSADIIDAILQAERELRSFDENARRVDLVYSGRTDLLSMADDVGLSDQEYDTFWASMEVLKPAIYAKPPHVVAKPRYSDAPPAAKTAAEIIERVINSEFERGNVDLALREVRDDLALANRGVLWITYENDGGKRICVEHLDRRDFLHEPARYWSEVGWVARRAWMTESQMKERFKGRAWERADYISARDEFESGARDDLQKAAVWEFWSKTNNKVYWVTEGVDEVLDEDEPHLKLRDFFPCPRPAYGTLKRRTLVPIPDYLRYQGHLEQINFLTSRIYTLLDRVRLVGLIPGGGDVGNAIETAMAENNAEMFIPVPAAAMTGAGDYVQWLPLDMIATTITGLIQARSELFADFDRLSGISDIMRGETEAQETLGAQRIKTQYGSVRVKDKQDEIVRVSRDSARISTELVCTNFDQKTLLDIAQMEVPTRKDVEREIKELTKAAKEEMEGLTKKAEEAAQSGQEVDPAQAQQMLQQAQAQIAEKYAPEFQRLQNAVVIEDVMDIIKDRKERGLIIDIETDSTVMVDEMAEKQARNELLQAFSAAVSSLIPLFQIGEPGVKLAVTMLGFTLQPYTRGNRQIESQLDELIENAPEIAAKMAATQGDDQNAELAEANNKLAEAEQMKAQAAMAGVQAKAQLDQANSQLKFAQLQQQAQDNERKAQQENEKLRLQIAQAETNALQAQELQNAKINNLEAQTAKLLASIGFDARKQELEEYRTAADQQNRQVDQAMSADRNERADYESDRSADMGERQQSFNERQALNEGDE